VPRAVTGWCRRRRRTRATRTVARNVWAGDYRRVVVRSTAPSWVGITPCGAAADHKRAAVQVPTYHEPLNWRVPRGTIRLRAHVAREAPFCEMPFTMIGV
jgi:hypothetical protein